MQHLSAFARAALESRLMQLGDVVLVKGYEGSPTPYIVAIVTGTASGHNIAVTMFPRGEQPQCCAVPFFDSEMAVDDWLKGDTLAYRMAAFPRP